MTYKVDYHIHTNYSDGTYSPLEIVKKYHEEGYAIIAVTDHDTVGGVEEAVLAGKALDLRVVPAVELSSVRKKDGDRIEIHLLAYHIDSKNEDLLRLCRILRGYREDRNRDVLAYLKTAGLPLEEEDLPAKPASYLGKPDMVRVIRKKYPQVRDPWALFDRFPKEAVDPQEVIQTILAAGGLPVLAHPYKIRELQPGEEGFLERLDDLVGDLVSYGLRGIECFHPSASRDEALHLVDLAEKYRLHMTEGSDFHGDAGHEDAVYRDTQKGGKRKK